MTKPNPDEYKIEQFAKEFRLNYQKDDEHTFIVDSFEMWSPNHPDNTENKWTLFIGVVIPGNRWQPDDADIIDLGYFDSLDDCLLELIKNFAKQVLENNGMVYDCTPDGEFTDAP